MTYLDLREGRVDHVTIFGCDDARTLRMWHHSAYSVYDDVVSQLKGQTMADTASPEWRRRAGGKIAICNMIMRWIERRLVELGHERPLTRKRQTKELIDRLRAEIDDLKGGM